MIDFIARRLVSIIPVLAVVAIFVFLMLRLTPGDPAAVIAGDNATSDQIADIRTKLGLDLPIWQQFFIWIGNILHGNLGESFFFKKTVTALIAQRLQPTLALSICTLIVAVSTAVPLGVIAAYRNGSLLDRVVMGFSVMGFSLPTFVIGYCLIYVFAIMPWTFDLFGMHIDLGGQFLPVQGYTRIEVDFWGFVEHMILPSITLGIIYVALIARITRASVLEVLNEDYIRTARAKGLSNRVVLMRHALRNAAVPILTVIGIGIALLIGGAVVTETVYGLPGLGRLTVEAVLSRDFPTIQAVILMFSVVYVVINLLIDISYTLFDPRIRY
jgi:peptide/nickel transport system permease protein